MAHQRLKNSLIILLNCFRHKLAPHSHNLIVKWTATLYKRHLKKVLIQNYLPLLDKTVMVALTYRCQCRCQHCGVALYKKSKDNELKSREILHLIDETRKLGARQIYFFGGEPLLKAELPYYIKYAKQKGFKTRLDTNAFLLNEKKAKELKEAGLDLIGISIDSPYESEHDKLRGISGLFNKAINGIKYCKENSIKCFISTYTTKSKLKNCELEKTINMAKRLNVKTRILSPISSGMWFNRTDLVLSSEEIMQLRSFLEKDAVYWESVDDKETHFSCNAYNKLFL